MAAEIKVEIVHNALTVLPTRRPCASYVDDGW
jgi:hypothetical protein